MVAAQPFYTTAAKEYGITGQQMGWNRALTSAEISQVAALAPTVVGFARVNNFTNSVSPPNPETTTVTLPTHVDGDFLVMKVTSNRAGITCPAGWTENQVDGTFTKVASSEPATVDVSYDWGQYGRISLCTWSVRHSDNTVYETVTLRSDGEFDSPGLAGTGLVLLVHNSYGLSSIAFYDGNGIRRRDSWNNPLSLGTYNCCAGDFVQIGPTPGYPTVAGPATVGAVYAVPGPKYQSTVAVRLARP